MYDVFSLKDLQFPKDFIWGAGYSGHQVEGNNIHSQRWYDEIRENYDELSGLACNSYELYETDIAMASSIHLGAFRTTAEWSRIEPKEGEFNEDAAMHYVKFFAGLKEKGIRVFATMHHTAHPQWFEEKGGIKNLENLKYFERFLHYIVPKIAPYVDYWNVINEFNLRPDDDLKLSFLRYHTRGYHIIKQYSSAPVSSAHALVYYRPYRPHDKWDNAMSNLRDLCDNEFFFHAIRTGELVYPNHDGYIDPDMKNAADYWSVNTYVRQPIDARKAGMWGKRYDFNYLRMIDRDFYLDTLDPECIIANLSRLTDKPVIITENGCSCDDDRFRIVWISLYLSALKEAMDMGVDVRGYLYWSLLDNYEWASFVPRFGLFSCDFKTFERTAKPSAHFYRDIIDNNGFSQAIVRAYLHELPSLGR